MDVIICCIAGLESICSNCESIASCDSADPNPPAPVFRTPAPPNIDGKGFEPASPPAPAEGARGAAVGALDGVFVEGVFVDGVFVAAPPAGGFCANICAKGLSAVAAAPPPPPPRPDSPPPLNAFIIGSWTSWCILDRALKPPGCASTFANARSASRICSRMSSGLRAASKVRRNISGSFSAWFSSGFRSSTSRMRGSDCSIVRSMSGFCAIWSMASRMNGELSIWRMTSGFCCNSRCMASRSGTCCNSRCMASTDMPSRPPNGPAPKPPRPPPEGMDAAEGLDAGAVAVAGAGAVAVAGGLPPGAGPFTRWIVCSGSRPAREDERSGGARQGSGFGVGALDRPRCDRASAFAFSRIVDGRTIVRAAGSGPRGTKRDAVDGGVRANARTVAVESPVVLQHVSPVDETLLRRGDVRLVLGRERRFQRFHRGRQLDVERDLGARGGLDVNRRGCHRDGRSRRARVVSSRAFVSGASRGRTGRHEGRPATDADLPRERARSKKCRWRRTGKKRWMIFHRVRSVVFCFFPPNVARVTSLCFFHSRASSGDVAFSAFQRGEGIARRRRMAHWSRAAHVLSEF